MSWLEENYSDKFDLAWWRVAFDMAAKALFASIDQLILQDVQVHNVPWIVQQTHTARLMTSLMNDSQPWHAEYTALRDAKDPREGDMDSDDDEDDDDDDGEDDGNEKQRYDETFLTLGKCLRCIKALTADLEDWFRIGNKRRLGKHLWHNRRMFLRTRALSDNILKLWYLTDTDIHSVVMKEPNVGASRSIRHGAVLAIWHQFIAPQVLATHTNLSRRCPPCVHPRRIEAERLLEGVDKVTQAPYYLVVTVLERVLNLSSLESMVLPYLVSGGCSDMLLGGVCTFGLDPVVSSRSLELLLQKKEDAESLVVLGPKGAGWGSDDKPQKAAEEAAARYKEMYVESQEQAMQMIDCAQLHHMISYWCPEHIEIIGRNIPPDRVEWRSYFETRLEDNRRITLGAELMLHHRNYYNPYDGTLDLKIQGARSKLGVKGVFRACVFVFMATVRIWKSTPTGLISYLEAIIKRAQIRLRGHRDKFKTAESKLRRAQTTGADADEVSKIQNITTQLGEQLDNETAIVDRYLERLAEAKSQRLRPIRPHPLKVAIGKAVESLIWIDDERKVKKGDKLKPSRYCNWFHSVCSLDTTKALLNDTRNGTFLVRYSLEPGIFVASWSEGKNKPLKSARIYRVNYVRSLKTEDSDDESDHRGTTAGGSRPSTAADSEAGRGGVSAPDEMQVEMGYGWRPDASLMELHATIPALLYASRGVLAHGVVNEIPQLDRNAGYL